MALIELGNILWDIDLLIILVIGLIKSRNYFSIKWFFSNSRIYTCVWSLNVTVNGIHDISSNGVSCDNELEEINSVMIDNVIKNNTQYMWMSSYYLEGQCNCKKLQNLLRYPSIFYNIQIWQHKDNILNLTKLEHFTLNQPTGTDLLPVETS